MMGYSLQRFVDQESDKLQCYMSQVLLSCLTSLKHDNQIQLQLKKEEDRLYEEFGLLYRVYKSLGNKMPYWPYICERCGLPLKEDLNDPGYRNYAWRFASYCINGNMNPSVKFDFDTTNLKIQILNANTPKFAVKLKLLTTMTHLSNAIENIEKEEVEGKGEGEDNNNNNILKDLDISILWENLLISGME
jgi:hypothetical protein